VSGLPQSRQVTSSMYMHASIPCMHKRNRGKIPTNTYAHQMNKKNSTLRLQAWSCLFLCVHICNHITILSVLLSSQRKSCTISSLYTLGSRNMGEYINTRRVVARIRSHAFKHAPPGTAGNVPAMEKKKQRKTKKGLFSAYTLFFNKQQF